ncbi:MAG: PPC domain-containing protein, partial [Limisphaerales bacterium]
TDEDHFEALVTAPKPEVRLESSNGGIITGDAIDNNKTLIAQITVSADAPASQEIRVESPAGVSNPMQIRISDLPEIAEAGGHHSVTNPEKITLPVGITGMIGEPDQTDFYGFAAKKGERLLFDVEASRTGSALDSSLAVLDATGHEIIRNEDANGLDSFIDFIVPNDGDYLLSLRDFQHRGSNTFKYHLSAGAIPYLDSFFPLGGQRGKPVEIFLLGRNLDQPKMKFFIEPNAPIGSQEVRAHTLKGFSNARSFDISEFPEFMENEPNDSTTNANAVALPGNFNGQIQKEKDADVFKFKAEKGQRFIFDIFASRFGSKLDPLLTLTDAKGTVLQRNDDAMGADARIDQTFPAAGEYFISVRDLLERGGENFGYRLSAKPPPAPTFSAKILQDTLRVNRGGRVIARVEIARADFSEAVEIQGADLPEGIFVSPLLIPAEITSGVLQISAKENSALGNFPLKLIAVSAIGGKKIIEPVQSVAGSPRASAKKKKGKTAKPAGKKVKETFLTVLEAAPFSVEFLTMSAALEQNQSGALQVEAQRHQFNG